MKASQLYVGEFYAWHPSPAKGKLTLGGQKVRVLNIENRKGRFETNARTWAEIIQEDGRKRWCRARELMDFWDNYEHEVEDFEKEKNERERIQLRARLREEAMALMVEKLFAEKTGLTADFIYNRHTKKLTIDEGPMMEWLGITEDQLESVIDDALAGANK